MAYCALAPGLFRQVVPFAFHGKVIHYGMALNASMVLYRNCPSVSHQEYVADTEIGNSNPPPFDNIERMLARDVNHIIVDA